MRKKRYTFIAFILAAVVSGASCFAGCSDSTGEYILQYTCDTGTYQLTVASGMPYSLEVIPERAGYNFIGLFDSEEGGKQYVSANGSSLAPFSAHKNLVLFPQYEAKNYTVILDYQGAAVTGERQLSVTYGQSLPQLPNDLEKEHCDFSGWYTEVNCSGT